MKKIPIKGTVYILPNLFTATNFALGIYAITLMLKGDGNYEHAALCIGFAMLFDVFDGLIARITNTTSEFGMEFDSLADLTSFGIAPAIMVYRASLSFMDSNELKGIGKFGFLICVIYAGCTALRLARYNSKIEDESKSFSGIPSPAAAGVIGSYFLLVGSGLLPTSVTDFATHWFLPFVTAGLGLLMVSNIKYPAPAKQNIWKKHPFVYLILAAGVIALIITNTGATLFCIALIYAAYGPISHFRNKRKMISDKTETVEQAPDIETENSEAENPEAEIGN